MRGLIVSGCFVCMAARGLAGEAWQISRAIAGAASNTTVVSVSLDAHVYANSQPRWADMRVLDTAGREVPRAVEAERAYRFEELHVEHQAKLASVETLPCGGLAVVCALEGTNAVELTQLTIRTPLRDFEQAVTVMVPAPGNTWSAAGQAQPIFDYSRYADVRKTSVTLPALTNRLLKIVIGQADDTVFSAFATLTEESDGKQTKVRAFKRYHVEQRPFRIDSVTLRHTRRSAVEDERRVERVQAPSFTVEELREQKRTVLTVETAQWPLTGLVLQPLQQNFDRRAEVACEAPGGWRKLAVGRLTRSRLPGMEPVSRDTITFPETRASKMRVVIENDDNQPLALEPGSVTCLRQAYGVLFIAEPGESYRLVYGNPAPAPAPVYEQGVLEYLRSGQKAAVWTLAAASDDGVRVGAAVRARRFLVQHGMLLASLAVMVVLGVLLTRALRRLPSL